MDTREIQARLIIAELRDKLSPSIPLVERLLIAMRAARLNWMAPDDNTAFVAAVVAVIETGAADEKLRLEYELKLLRGVSAALSGLPIDFGRLIEDPATELILRKLWDESATEPEESTEGEAS